MRSAGKHALILATLQQSFLRVRNEYGIPFPSLPIQPPLHALATCCIPLWRQQVAGGQSAQRYSQATLFPPYKLGDFYVNVAGTGEKWKNLCWKSFNWRIFGHLQWSMKIFFTELSVVLYQLIIPQGSTKIFYITKNVNSHVVIVSVSSSTWPAILGNTFRNTHSFPGQRHIWATRSHWKTISFSKETQIQ